MVDQAPALTASADLREAERFCAEMARREAKNFYWGFISLEHHQRMAIYALYDFARQVDDEVDEAGTRHLAARLEAHRERIRACARNEFRDQVSQVLAHAMRRYNIPESELLELIEGVQTDSYQTRFRSWDDLRGYCRLVASVVGRMCVRIFGFSDPVALERADELGLAMQLTNILRDVREDAQRGRIYLPQDDLARFGIDEADLLNARLGARWEELVAFEVLRARNLYATGVRVVDYIPWRSAVCVRTMAGIYERILDKIEEDPRLPLRARASLSRAEKLHVMVGSWLLAG
jgi:15-cis-phytoene synthase